MHQEQEQRWNSEKTEKIDTRFQFPWQDYIFFGEAQKFVQFIMV